MSEWRRLSPRVVWIDVVRSLIAVAPGVVAIVVFDVDASLGSLWPLLAVAVVGVGRSLTDVVRWAFTRYRVLDDEVERRTGVLVRRVRTLPRERIRSVDTHAKLLHRAAGLRVVTVGAGQQTGAGESALVLDALTREEAEFLHHELLGSAAQASVPTSVPDAEPDAEPESVVVLETFRPWWVVYNMVSIWSFVTAIGVCWGAHWTLTTFGVDLAGRIVDWFDRAALGWVTLTAVALGLAGLVGALWMGARFLAGYWRFELARVRSGAASHLRTRRGLFSTREVNRDESRIRGLTLSEPVVWRWMGMADTTIITTGLSNWNAEQPTAILPRGPVRTARRVAEEVLGAPSPLAAPLARHPRVALRRRLWWATWSVVALAALLVVPVLAGAVPAWLLAVPAALWPVALGAAIVAYRALGHAVVGDHLVLRSGLMSRATSVLRRDAVSTVAVSQSVLQRRLGLSTLSAMSAAGWGIYQAPDVAAVEVTALADRAAPGVLDEFRESCTAPAGIQQR